MTSGILITARLKSTRLPKKVLKPICGLPMLDHLVSRLRKSLLGDSIVLCTSLLEQDDPLIERANFLGIDSFRGHADDVINRLSMACSHFGLTSVISCTADNPLICPEYVDKLEQFRQANSLDFAEISGLPLGAFGYAVDATALKFCSEIKVEEDTEIWGPLFTKSGFFKCGKLVAVDQYQDRELRLTVDTRKDFELVESLYRAFDCDPPKTPDLIRFLKSRPWLTEINANIVQKKAPEFSFRACPLPRNGGYVE